MKIPKNKNTGIVELHPLGPGLSIGRENDFIELWRNGGLVFRRDIDSREKSPEFRLLIVELSQEYKAQKTKLSNLFSISRQTIDDWIASYIKHGISGLINSTKNIGNSHRLKENKGKINSADKQYKQQEISKLQYTTKDLTLPAIPGISEDHIPYQITVEKQDNRYAGVFVMQLLLEAEYSWFNWVIGLFGEDYKIFQVFSLMFSKNIRSIEQLKNVRSKEAGAVMGLSKLPSLPGIWTMFYNASNRELSDNLLSRFFTWQVSVAKVSSRFWFTDGHVLPYTGKEKMHHIFNTKKREVEPGSISFVSSDFSGKIVDFELKEGGAGLREHILNLHDKWSENFDKQDLPVHVFDREGDGCEFFYNMVKRDCPFITWEKNSNRKKLYDIQQSEFNKSVEVNGVEYLYFEDSKSFIHKESPDIEQKFSLRRFWIINTRSKKRTSALAFSGKTELSQDDCIYGILNRWGASENTFKHLGSRHPLAYRPGFKLETSNNQIIINPEIKTIDKKIKQKDKEQTRQCKVLATKEKVLTKTGEERKNGIYGILKAKIENLAIEKQDLKEQKSKMPEKIDISELTDYKQFKNHDNEGKNLFDFVNSVSWNARKKGVEMLDNLYPHKNDIVDLFYAIIDSAGTVNISEKEIIVVLEPLQQSSRRIAQIEFCRKLTQMGAKTPSEKKMIIKVSQN